MMAPATSGSRLGTRDAAARGDSTDARARDTPPPPSPCLPSSPPEAATSGVRTGAYDDVPTLPALIPVPESFASGGEAPLPPFTKDEKLYHKLWTERPGRSAALEPSTSAGHTMHQMRIDQARCFLLLYVSWVSKTKKQASWGALHGILALFVSACFWVFFSRPSRLVAPRSQRAGSTRCGSSRSRARGASFRHLLVARLSRRGGAVVLFPTSRRPV